MAPQLDAAPLPISPAGSAGVSSPSSPRHVSGGVTPSEVAYLIGERT